MSEPVFRFAPSPNGELHLGHALSAILNCEWASRTGGRFLLRIEDIDLERCTPEYERGIYDDLAWLGVGWEKPPRRQSEHFAEYQAVLDRLVRQELVYPAFMSRGEIRAFISDAETPKKPWPRDPDGVPLYPGADRELSQRERRRRIASGARARLAARRRGGGGPGRRTSRRPVVMDGTERGIFADRPDDRGAPAAMGRRRAGAQGRADQLPSVGCRR